MSDVVLKSINRFCHDAAHFMYIPVQYHAKFVGVKMTAIRRKCLWLGFVWSEMCQNL